MVFKQIPGKKYDKIIVGIVLVLVLIMFYQGINIGYQVDNGVIRVKWFTGVTIPIKDITEVKILDNTPPLKKVMGVDLGKIKQGTYSIEGIGRIKLYARNIERKLVLVKTDKMIYGLTPEDPNQFAKLITQEREKLKD